MVERTASRPVPERNCDVVMKGGITSGIVYPKAIHELSQRYRFRSIGGTSAGAIAAAATAAAEVSRQRGNGAAFDTLAELPELLSKQVRPGGPSRLFSLFRPQRATAPIFRTLVAGLGKGKKWKILPAALKNFFSSALLGFAICGLPTAGWAFFFYHSGGLLGAAVWIGAAGLLTVVCVLAAVALSFVRRIARAVPENFYGLCTGYSEPPAGASDPEPPLTPWLYGLLNDLAGQPRERPLTFGDLWWPDGARPDPLPEAEPTDAAVRLQMMTTSLTHGRPYRLPFAKNEGRLFFFKPAELARFFPPVVVDWMVKHARSEKDDRRQDDFLPLPAAADLPVIVAVRMSLSFPLLISAVPLHTVDYSRPREKQALECCWFSDGGIASNFPVHFFDGPLPRWPTFTINLRPYHRDYPGRHFHKAKENSGGIEEWWWTIERGSGLKRILSFVDAISNAMQNWGDNAQLKLPGYRDRVVHVSLMEEEGGMNLNMPDALIQTLGARGREAAQDLADDFEGKAPQGGKAPELTWANHRWVRFRTLMALLEDQFGRLGAALAHKEPGDRSWDELIARGEGEEPRSYPLKSEKRRKAAAEAVRALAELSKAWEEGADFTKDAPNPAPELRVRPRI